MSLKGELYRRYIGSQEEKTCVTVTEERNGYAVFCWVTDETGEAGSTTLLKWFAWDRNGAIEFAVNWCRPSNRQMVNA